MTFGFSNLNLYQFSHSRLGVSRGCNPDVKPSAYIDNKKPQMSVKIDSKTGV